MKKVLCLALMAVMTVTACEKGFLFRASEDVDVQGNLSHGMIVLGDQLEDPYTVNNMTKAFNELYPTKAGLRITVDPTHLYVRFLPQDEEQYESLQKICPIILDHPMDYEIITEGDFYHDPDIPDEQITWQYAVVNHDFVFPQGIRCEVLDSCYIPDSSTKAEGVDWDAVEREAYRITGNEKLCCSSTKAGSGSVPSGRITIVDSDLSKEPVGVKGVMVSCNTFVKFSNVYTDSEGNYKMNKSFAAEPRYRIVYKNFKGFGIGINLLLIPASVSTLGQASAGGLDVNIDSSSERKMFLRSAVNNAAYEYYEKCESSDNMKISTPPADLRIWLFHNLSKSSSIMLQQGAFLDGSFIADYLGEYLSLVKMFLPDITLGVKEYKTYSEIYAATVHELAHASHFMSAGKEYWNPYITFIAKSFLTSGFVTYGAGTEEGHGYCEVGEMWAYYMESMMYRERYGDNSKVFGTSFWFSPQILMYLDERGLNRYQIFQALGEEVVDKELLQDTLLSLYPQFKSTINQAFGRYN